MLDATANYHVIIEPDLALAPLALRPRRHRLVHLLDLAQLPLVIAADDHTNASRHTLGAVLPRRLAIAVYAPSARHILIQVCIAGVFESFGTTGERGGIAHCSVIRPQLVAAGGHAIDRG